MPRLRTVLHDTEPGRFSVRDVLETDFFVDTPRASMQAQLDRMRPYDAAVILIHGVGLNPGVGYGDMEEKLRERWPDELRHTLFVKLYWGSDSWSEWSSVIGTRTDQVYGMSNEAWSGTAKLADAIGRVKAVLGDDCPVCVLAHSQGCAVTLAALQEGLKIDNFILLGSPLDALAVEQGTRNTRFLDAIRNVKGAVINCSSSEDGISQLGATLSAIGASGAAGGPIGRDGLPASVLRHPKVKGLYLREVDHNGDEGWWAAKWVPEGAEVWRGTTPDHFIRTLASIQQRTEVSLLRPREGKELDEHLAYVNSDTRGGWFGWNDRNSFKDTIYLPAHSRVRWHFDDKDDARYAIDVLEGTLRVRMQEAEWDTWERNSGWQAIDEADGEKVRTLKTTGVDDATYMLEIENPYPTHAVAVVQFTGWDR